MECARTYFCLLLYVYRLETRQLACELKRPVYCSIWNTSVILKQTRNNITRLSVICITTAVQPSILFHVKTILLIIIHYTYVCLHNYSVNNKPEYILFVWMNMHAVLVKLTVHIRIFMYIAFYGRWSKSESPDVCIRHSPALKYFTFFGIKWIYSSRQNVSAECFRELLRFNRFYHLVFQIFKLDLSEIFFTHLVEFYCKIMYGYC